MQWTAPLQPMWNMVSADTVCNLNHQLVRWFHIPSIKKFVMVLSFFSLSLQPRIKVSSGKAAAMASNIYLPEQNIAIYLLLHKPETKQH